MVECVGGCPQGEVKYYNVNGNELYKDQYFTNSLLSDIKETAKEVKYDEIRVTQATVQNAKFKFNGTVKEVYQYDKWTEVVIKDDLSNYYIGVYSNEKKHWLIRWCHLIC